MMCDLRIVMKLVIVINAKATEHILHRQGVRHMKHIDVAQFWLQDDVARLWLHDEVRSNRLILPRVDSEHNVACLGTRALSRAVIKKHAATLRYVNLAEEYSAEEKQDVVISWDVGSLQEGPTTKRTVSTVSHWFQSS